MVAGHWTPDALGMTRANALMLDPFLTEHTAGVIVVQQAAADEPAQHPATYLFGDGIAIPQCQCLGLSDPDPVVLDDLAHTSKLTPFADAA